MPRRRVATKRTILPDPKFHSVMVARFINVLMKDGKKAVAEKVVYGALNLIEERSQAADKQKAMSEVNVPGDADVHASVILFLYILDQVRPAVEVKPRRVGGATYQIPIEVRQERGIALGMRWLVQAARGRSEHGMMKRLSGEFLDVLAGRGSALKKREDTHRMAKANQAFAHFRWN